VTSLRYADTPQNMTASQKVQFLPCFRAQKMRGFVRVQPSLFTEFDCYWQPWNSIDDTLKLAADIANDKDFPADCQQIADRYDWEPRRLNPAITYLFDRGMLFDYKAFGMRQFVTVRVVGREDEIRLFLKSRV
jgi:hypothetical protein